MSDIVVQLLSHVQLFATPWTAACQASLSSPHIVIQITPLTLIIEWLDKQEILTQYSLVSSKYKHTENKTMYFLKLFILYWSIAD